MLSFGFIMLLCLNSCEKQQAKKLEGNYDCIVTYIYWDITPTTIDSTYFETLSVTRSGKYICVLSQVIHIDSLLDGREYYKGDLHNYIKIRFENETIFATTQSGGLGGGSTLTYEGSKAK